MLTRNLSTIRLLLKEITWDDLQTIHAIHSRPEVDEFATLGIPRNEEDTKDYMRPYINNEGRSIKKSYAWLVYRKEENVVVGLVGMHNSLDRFNRGEIWYKLLPEAWGKGYATEAASRIIEFGFNELKLHRIEAGVATMNSASIKVLEKLGMRREGLKRKVLPIRGEWVDNFHYAILEEDLEV